MDEMDDRKPGATEETQDGEWSQLDLKREHRVFAVMILAYGLAALLYHHIIGHDLGRTGVMFIGLPTMLAVVLALAPPAKTSTGSVMKGITLFLLLVAPLMGEGYLCILIASPLFYLVGALVGFVADRTRNKENTKLGACALILLPFCFEGTIPTLTIPREESVDATRIVVATPDEVQQALAQPVRVQTKMPWLLRIGFPRPDGVSGSGLALGSIRVLHFTGAETAPPGILVSAVDVSRPGYAHFQVVTDHTKVTEWMRWRSSEVTWYAVDATHTRVTWRIQYARGLDPAWYFGPWEHVVVKQCAEYLIRASATPAEAAAL